ncbi:type IV pilin protein [Photobacterium kasasachensis]|uniref:type IV pilin protein n=1 Tax=Photobacterium kasasachensis TaxID=2910240 RepID=UPI003D106621
MSQIHNCQKGMTLIELLVVVAIVGIISAFAYPAYTDHVTKSYREDAKAGLVRLQLWMEEQYSTNGSYPAAVDNTSCPGCNLNLKRYDYGATSGAGANIYKLSATPKSDDTCGTLYLNAAGVGSASGSGNCW